MTLLFLMNLGFAWGTQGGGPVAPPTNPWYEGKTIYPLPSVAGLTEWVDYIPVEAQTLNPGRFDEDGAFPVVQVLSDTTGLVSWVDYIPVFVVDRTRPWRAETDGFVPFQDTTP